MRVLSVDLGTSNTVAVLSAHGRPPRVVEVDGSATMPSAIFANEDGTVVVGRDAERRARLDPTRFEPNPKRRIDESTLLLGSTVITVTDTLSAILQRVGEETSRQLGGLAPDEIRLTHPAQWGSVRRSTLLAAARLAGLGPNLTLVPEPVAAAAHFASFPDRALAPGQALAVYDLGAGTFDCAVVGATQSGFVVLAEDGLPDLGGLDVDHALLVHVGREVSYRDPARWQRLLRPESTADRRARRTLLEDVRAAKEALSRHPQTEVPMPEEFSDVLVTRTELEALIRPSLLRSVDVLASTITKAGMTPDTLAGIYLVGGSSRIPLVAQLIAERLRVVPISLDQPETGVALGAHHVPQDGTGMRTADLSSQFSQPAAPQSGGFPAYGGPQQQGYANETTQQLMAPQHGQPQHGQHHGQPQYGGPQYPGGYPGQARPAKSRKPLFIGIGITVVVAILAVGGFFLLRGDSLPTAQDCQQQGESDGKGFTRCLRQLAGTLADGDSCKTGLLGGGTLDGLKALTGAMVTCEVKDDKGTVYSVVYTHAPNQQQTQLTSDMMMSTSKNERVEAKWEGNGLKGQYKATTNASVGMLVFTVDDRPLSGMVTAINLGGSKATANDLADFFEKKIMPGT